MSDWPTWFRELAQKENEKGEATVTVCGALSFAADEIERLTVENAHLRASLKVLNDDHQKDQ